MTAATASRVQAVRRFNRFYTGRIGVVNEGVHSSPYTLAEARVMYELGQQSGLTVSELSRALELDAGYVSRLVRRLERRGLVSREASKTDGRQWRLRLTSKGQDAFADLDHRSDDAVESMLAALPASDQERLVASMRAIERLLGGASAGADRPVYVLRSPEPGDLGWVVERHGALYAAEQGWGERFEGIVAQVVADFAANCGEKRQRCWIAESEGERVGCVFVVKDAEKVARLRLLLVEPRARGTGLGSRLVDECIRFARRNGYEKMTLWTMNVLHAARRIYEKAGFRLVHSEPDDMFGPGLISETWDLDL